MCLGRANKRRRRTDEAGGGAVGGDGGGGEGQGERAVGRAGDAGDRIGIRREKRLRDETLPRGRGGARGRGVGGGGEGGGEGGGGGGDTNCQRVIYAGAFGRAGQITLRASRLPGGLI